MVNNRKGAVMLEKAEDLDTTWAYNLKYSKDSDVTLLNNVQFIYELSLAKLELEALGADFQITNGLREFKIHNKSDELKDKVKRFSAYFKTYENIFTDYFYIIQKNQTRSVNQYLTHWIYPYKGKFHPQMIRALLNIIGLKEGETVLDPFSGSGTTALEAQLLGINCIGIDISALCVLQGKVKTESIYALKEIIEIKQELLSKLLTPTGLFKGEKKFYEVLEEIKNEKVRNFYTLARLLALSDKSRRNRSAEQSFAKNTSRMIASVSDYNSIFRKLQLRLGKVDLQCGDARNVKLSNNSVDGIITSPPYSIALDYVENDAHSLKDLGFDLDVIRETFIGVRGSGKKRVELYNEDIEKAYGEMYRVLKPGKFAVIVIGNATYQTSEIKTVEFTIEVMEKLGFKLVKNLHKIIFGLYNMMKEESILIFEKPR